MRKKPQLSSYVARCYNQIRRKAHDCITQSLIDEKKECGIMKTKSRKNLFLIMLLIVTLISATSVTAFAEEIEPAVVIPKRGANNRLITSPEIVLIVRCIPIGMDGVRVEVFDGGKLELEAVVAKR